MSVAATTSYQHPFQVNAMAIAAHDAVWALTKAEEGSP